jgi:hypothetical protein
MQAVVSESPNPLDGSDEARTPPAEQPPTAHQQLARGRVAETPASLISWVTFAIAVAAALAVLVAFLVYELA